MHWIDVGEFLPGLSHDFVIVRAINKDEEPFYMMAIYTSEWHFFEDDRGYEKHLKVTHWCIPDSSQTFPCTVTL